jgi:peptidoglycan/LPS O-acetylase OafA/YrhL
MTSPTANRPHYPALDGLRGLAILLVVFYHNFGFINYFFFGWLGVDLFFVLSGFLITDILLKTKSDPHYLRNFYGRRVLRIFPIYYLVLVIFLLIIPSLKLDIINVDYYKTHQLWLWVYLQNWLYIFRPVPPDSLSLSHLWSLAVEEQFYLIWPFVILLIGKVKPLFLFMLTLLLLVITARLLVWLYHIEKIAYFNLYTFSRIDGICIGSMMALLRQMNPRFLQKNIAMIVLALAGLNFIFYFFNNAYSFSFPFLAIIGYTTFAVVFGILVNEAVNNNKTIALLFDNSIMKFFGRISYGLYIFHWPIYLILSKLMVNLPNLLTSVIATIIATIFSWLSFEFFEAKILKLKKNFKYTTVNY